MSTATAPRQPAAPPPGDARLQAALARAGDRTGAARLAFLAAETGLAGRALAQAMQPLAGLSLADGGELLADRLGTPDDDLLPLIDAVGRHCTALRAPDGTTLVLLADPFDTGTRRWLRWRLMRCPRRHVRWRLVDAESLQAHLHRREQSTRVAGSLRTPARCARRRRPQPRPPTPTARC